MRVLYSSLDEKSANAGLKHILEHNFEFSENTNALSADGVKIDRILAIEYIPEDFNELMSKPSIFLETYMRLRSRVHPTGDPPLQVFCRTLAQDAGFYRLERQKYPESILDLAADLAAWSMDLENANVLQQLVLRPEAAPLELMLRDFFRPSDPAQYKSRKPRPLLSRDDIFRILSYLPYLSHKSLFWTARATLALQTEQ